MRSAQADGSAVAAFRTPQTRIPLHPTARVAPAAQVNPASFKKDEILLPGRNGRLFTVARF